MTAQQRLAYQRVVAKIAKGLGIKGNEGEDAIIAHCLDQIHSIVAKSGTTVSSLAQLRDVVAAQLNLSIFEVHSPDDLKSLLQKYPATNEPVIARIPLELDDRTDAIVVHRPNCQPWDRPYLAVINCMGEHFHKRYFSKWHEIVHLLLEGRQMTFAFRRTHEAEKHQPLEQLVDRVAGQLAFYRPLFKPAFEATVSSSGLSFAAISAVRSAAAPEASRLATTMACVREFSGPVLYARLGMGFKKSEKAALAEPDLFPESKAAPAPKLRVLDSISNGPAQALGLQMFRNMSVSDGSLAARALNTTEVVSGDEDFALWRDDVPIKRVVVEAVKIGSDVHCLIQLR